MRIAAVRTWTERVPLRRPYAIARESIAAVDLALLELTAGGVRGLGLASPAVEVTGEAFAACTAALQPDALAWLVGRDPGDPALETTLAERIAGPAARAAVDMALIDLWSRSAGRPLADLWGRARPALPTSVTIGILPLAQTLAEADEHLARGFTALKIKIGGDVDADLERLARLRERCGPRIALRADANEGYDEAALRRFGAGIEDLGIELLEQPLPRGRDEALRALPAALRSRFCADESVLGAADLQRLLAGGCPFGIVNVKLMKCGGPRPARRLAQLAGRHGLRVMWGCNDESVLGIAAALHAAYAEPATHFLDLDGSFDLARDPCTGGCRVDGGRLHTVAAPGLGADLS